MAEETELFLKHSNFTSQYNAGFKELRSSRQLFDVTLATDGGEAIDAHKVILSAISPLFKQIILQSKNHNHPFIYLKGVKSEHLGVIVEFIYNGEAVVPANQLDKFLEVAQDLEINGLAYDEKNESCNVEIKKTNMKKENIAAVDSIAKEDHEHETETLNVEPINVGFGTKLEEGAEIEIDFKIDEETLNELEDEIVKNMKQGSNSEGKKVITCRRLLKSAIIFKYF